MINEKKVLSMAFCSIVLLSSTQLVGCNSEVISATLDTESKTSATDDMATDDNLNEELDYCLVDFGNHVELLKCEFWVNYKLGYVVLTLEDGKTLELDRENVMLIDKNSRIQVDLANEILKSNNQEETIPYQKSKSYE